MVKKEMFLIAISAALEAGESIKEIYNSDYVVETKDDQSPITTADKKSHQVIEDRLIGLGYPILSEEGKKMTYNQREDWNEFWVVDPLDGTKEFIKKNGEFTVNIAWVENGKSQFGVIYAPIPDVLYYGIQENGAFRITDASKKLKDITFSSLEIMADVLPIDDNRTVFRVVASRSHGSEETERFVEFVKNQSLEVEMISRGSSLKLCMIAEGIADIYPRFGLTSEWDIAAGHAIINAAGGKVLNVDNLKKELIYNKVDLLNPYFIAYSDESKEYIIDRWSKA